jgi:sugar phosphate isomerase/epimerase
LAIENLNRSETNFLNSVEEVLSVVKRVNHPNLRLCADIYHMLREGEGPAILEKASNYLVHCDLAERDERTPPGVRGDDFRPYFEELKRINYQGRIVLECDWEDLANQAGPALQALRNQLNW